MHDDHTNPTNQITQKALEALETLENMVSAASEEVVGASEDADQAERLDALAQESEAAGCGGLAEAIRALDGAIRESGGREHLHPSTIEAITDAITGTRELVEAVSLGDLTASLEPALFHALRGGGDSPDGTMPEDPSTMGPADADPPAEVEGPTPFESHPDAFTRDAAGEHPDVTTGGEMLDSPSNGFASSSQPETGEDDRIVTPDPNQPLDPTGGFEVPDPNQALDPTGGFAVPDPNQALDPTGGFEVPDPNQALDPTGGFEVPDPNQPLDPTGGAMPDPNQALDPTGGGPAPAAPPEEQDDEWGSYPLSLDDGQVEMLQFMVTDVRRTVEELGPVIAEAEEFSTREEAASRLVTLGDELGKLADFFELPTFAKLVELLKVIGGRLPQMGEDGLPELLLRMRAIAALIDQYCGGLEVGFELRWPLKKMTRRIMLLLDGKRLHPELCAWHQNDTDRLLELDGVVDSVDNPPAPATDEDTTGGSTGSASRANAATGGDAKVQTIRVEKATFDRLLDIQRQLVLNKNFFLETIDAMPPEQKGGVGGIMTQRALEYARLTEQLRHCLDHTRVQPVGVLLERFERVVRDVASLGDRQVDFIVKGEETPIDKFTIDRLADPFGRLLRHVAGHAIEPSNERADHGKAATGTLRVSAEHEGSHVSIILEHDGEIVTTQDILTRASMFEHVDLEELDGLNEHEIQLLPYRDWFSDSDLSGLYEELGAIGVTLEQRTTREGRTRIRLRMVVEGAVIGVISVRAGDSVYALPMQQVDEITPLRDDMCRTVHKRPAVSFRGSPILLLDPEHVFNERLEQDRQHVVVIFRSRGTRYAFRADRVLGSSEIVLERLGVPAYEGPFLGGAIRNDGSIALVLDCERLPEFHRTPDAERDDAA